MEANRPGVMSTQRKRIRRSQSCVAAQIIFHCRGEPTQVEIAICASNDKSCFAVTVLGCDFLHDIIAGKRGKEAYTGGIACEQFTGEGIDLVIRNGHAHQRITAKRRSLDELSAIRPALALRWWHCSHRLVGRKRRYFSPFA